MQALLKKTGILIYFLAAILLVQAVPLHALYAADRPRLENIRFEVAGRMVYIYYDLIAPTDRTYTVRVTLRRGGNTSFQYKPVNVAGDVGSGVYPGVNRRIAWNISKEFPNGLEGEDLYFVVETDEPPGEGIPAGYFIAGGAVLIGGIVTAIILSNRTQNQPPSSGPSAFPPPPGRP